MPTAGDAGAEVPRTTRGALGSVMVVLSTAALGIALYLTWTKLQGQAPACGIIHGCAAVEESEYSEFLGIPVAAYGSVATAMTLAASFSWWRRADPRALYAVYGLGLISLLALAYLAYLEVAVIHAVCIWCVSFTILIGLVWVIATYVLYRRSRRPEVGPPDE